MSGWICTECRHDGEPGKRSVGLATVGGVLFSAYLPFPLDLIAVGNAIADRDATCALCGETAVRDSTRLGKRLLARKRRDDERRRRREATAASRLRKREARRAARERFVRLILEFAWPPARQRARERQEAEARAALERAEAERKAAMEKAAAERQLAMERAAVERAEADAREAAARRQAERAAKLARVTQPIRKLFSRKKPEGAS